MINIKTFLTDKLYNKRFSKLFLNFYSITSILFLLWMVFFDIDSVSTRILQVQKNEQLKSEKDYYLKQLSKIKSDRLELRSNKTALEKFARENFYLRKKGETVYLFEN